VSPAPLTGVLAAVGSAAAFGVTVVAQRSLATRGLPVASTLSVRFVIAGAALLAFLALRRLPLLPARGERVRAGLLGAVGYAVEAALFYAALQRGSAAAVALLFYAYPAIVTLVEVALRLQPPRLLAFGVVALSSLGAGLIVVTGGSDASITRAGVAFALGSAATYSGYMLLSQHVISRSHPAAIGAYVALGAALALGTAGLVTGSLGVPARDLPLLALNGVATAAAFALLYTALAHLTAGAAAVVMTLEAFVAVALAALLLDERIEALQVVGGVAIVAAAVIVAVGAKADVVDPDAPPVP
jgi:drug/metabolite transporter (DMT)-like permease